jgi:hypothetical protein
MDAFVNTTLDTDQLEALAMFKVATSPVWFTFTPVTTANKRIA